MKIKKIIDKIKIRPKKMLFNNKKATIVLPTKKVKPLLRRSEIFNKEYEKEKSLLSWK